MRRTLLPATASVAIIAMGLFVAAQNAAAQGNVLTFGDNFFVTGDYAIGGAVLGKSNNGFVTGEISIGNDQNPGVTGTNTVPLGAEIVAALLYWQEIEIVGGATGQNGFFRPVFNGGPQKGYPIKGTILKNPNGIVHWDGTGCQPSSTTPKQLVTYRQEVRAFLPQDAQGNVIANGQYEVVMPSQSNGSPLTVGVSLVIIYRVLSPNFPLNSIVIYDGTPASALETTQNIQGFYDAPKQPFEDNLGRMIMPVSKLTYIAGNGRMNLSETLSLIDPISLNATPLPSLYGKTLPPFPGWYGAWDNPTWFLGPNTNPLPEDASSATTKLVSLHQGCVTPAAIIYSTTVKNSDGDGLLDSWKTNQGYCDASFNEGGNFATKALCTGSQWVDLSGASLGTAPHPHQDVFVQLDYMCYKQTGPDSCDTMTSFANPLSAAASAAPDGTTTYTGVFSPTFPLNTVIAISGFINPQNNGNFVVVSNTGNQLVVNNANGVAEVHAGTSTFTGANSFDEVKTAYSNKNITLHPEWHAMAETPGCTDIVVSGIPSYCPYLNQPGLVGWKGGFDALKGQPLNYPDESSCEQALTGPCMRRFQHGRKDSYHEVIFAHAQGGPEWSFQAGTLTTGALCPAGTACIAQVGNTITFYTSTSHGLVAASGPNDQNPLARVTVSDAITNTMLNGTYLVQNVSDKSFTIQVGFAANATYTPSTDPRLSAASGRIHTRSGFSDVGGADSLVTLGRWDPLLAQQVTGTTFMHEFGHANGLSHGGYYYDQLTSSNNNYIPTVEANCKPNFQSVMNYPFQLDHLDTGTHKVVDYSEEQLDPLNEQNLPPGVTISLNPPFYPNTLWYTPTKPSANASAAKLTCDGFPVPSGTTMYLVSGSADPISPAWANNQDINFDLSTNLPTDTQMRGHSDWTNVLTNGLVISPGMNLLQIGATGADAFGSGGSLGPGGGSLGPGGGSLGPGGGSLGPGGGSLGPGGGSLGPGGGSLGPGGGSLGPGGGSLGPGGGVGEVDFATATAVTYPPSDLTATEGVSPRTITLNWTAGFGLIAFYKIYRSDDGGKTFHVVGTVNAPTTTFVDNPACNPPTTGYQYFVTAVQSSSSPNPGQESGPSNTVSTGQKGETLTACYGPAGFNFAVPANAVQGSIASITWTLQDLTNKSGFAVNRAAANTLVANGPVPISCASGQTTILLNGNPQSGASTITVNNGQFSFNWDTDGFCAGSYTFTLKLESGQQATTSTLKLSIDVTDTDSTPHITMTTVPNGAVGNAYSTTISEDGGVTGPFTWTLASGSNPLPGGLSPLTTAPDGVSGLLSGTPTTAGTFNFTVQVTDSAGNVGTQTLTMVVFASATAPYGLVSWYPFEGNANDLEKINNGSVLGTPKFVPGEVDNGFKPGPQPNSNIITIPDSATLALPQFTIGTWVRVDALDNVETMQIVWKGDNTAGDLTTPYSLSVLGSANSSFSGTATVVGMAGPGKVLVILTDGSGTHELDLLSTNALSLGTFHYVAVTADGQKVNLYIDGVLDGNSPASESSLTGLPFTNTNPLQIGGVQGGPAPGNNFDGVIDELQIWNRVLTPGEISGIFHTVGEFQPVSRPTGLVSWWPAEGSYTDIIGQNNGTAAGGTGFAPGEVGQAFSFNGVDGKITVADNVNLDVGQITIEAWVNPRSSGQGRPILQKRSSSNVGGYTFETTNSPAGPANGLQFVIWIGGVQQTLQTPANALALNAWQHVAATFDGSTMAIYVNGVQQASLAVSGSIDPDSTDPLVMGLNVVNGSDWDGFTDEVSLYNRALTSAEILSIVNAGGAGKAKP